MEMLSTLPAEVGGEEPISVYIIEDHEDYTDTIKELINDEVDMYCEFTFDCCEDYLDVYHQIPPPKVLLVDIGLKTKMNGIEGTRKFHELNPEIKIVMLTNSDSDKIIFEAMCAGAVGYVIKDNEPEVLLAKIREASNGGTAMSSRATRAMQNALVTMFKPKEKKDYGLTRRELEVLKHMVQSKSRREIAEILFIAFPTVDAHVQNIYRKLGVNTNVQAVKKAIKEGLVDDDDEPSNE